MVTAPSSEFLALQQIVAGRYSIERELGRGGMGVVFLARDVALDRPVALKLLPLALAAEQGLRERFLREARTAAKLSHPHIVPIHTVEEHGPVVFFVMTYVDGETLGQRIRRAGPLPPSGASRIVQEVAWALAYAHGRGVVHRDVKPDNILLDKDSGRAMVTDFGIARIADSSTLSGAGEIVGTIHYMSPEQASGEAVDGRSDLFSLGVTAFYALTGRLPFEGPNLAAVALRIVNADAPRLTTVRPDVSTTLASAIDKCLAKSPELRFESGEELAESIGVAVVSTEAAPQIRYLLKTGRDLDPAFSLLMLAGLVLPSSWTALAESGSAIPAVIMLGMPAIMTTAQLFYATRQAIKGGFGPTDLRRAFSRAELAAREEAAVVWSAFQDDTAAMRNRTSYWKWLGHAGAGGFLAGLATQALLKGQTPDVIYPVTVLSLMVGALGYLAALMLKRRATARTVSRRSPLAVGERLLGTRFADWLFRVAGIGLRVQAQNIPPARERTEALVAAAASDVFDRLPSEVRARFSSAPRVIQKLETDAARLRSRLEQIDRRESPVSSASSHDAESSRGRVQERLASAVAALESIRLDLLRLEAGIGSLDDLTADIERAAEIGTEVEAESYARDEIARALIGRSAAAADPTPPRRP